jgi:ABC-type multidrug transport system fused ATPase/permease subunit
MVLQDTILFRGSLAENIAFGSKDVHPESIRRAAELALVDEFADRLPDGLDTLVGERGASLSGGQRQRVAIARALLRNAPILILDEPTSALDAESEALVVRALKTLTEGRTTLIIAHRLSTVKGADRIIMVEDGRISGSGPHEELRRSSSTYARMVELQGMSTLGRLTADDEAGDHGRGLAADS